MKKQLLTTLLLLLLALTGTQAQERRPIDSRHPLWLVHIDVWNKADPQKIIDLIPEDLRPYVCMNLSLSCQYDTEKNVYKMPQNAILTYKSWASVCQANGLWFTCQPASGGHTHIQDDDLETFEYFFRRYPNFLGWNYAEQFWGFDEPGDKSSASQTDRIQLFANLVPMSHRYGGVLTSSFCGNIWSFALSPVGMLKRNAALLAACKQYPEAILWLNKYTLVSCYFNMESSNFGPYVSGLAKNYGVRYDNCGYNSALDKLFGEKHGKKYPVAAGIGTVMEQTCVNGGAVWDGPELIWTEDFQNKSNTTVDGYTRRNWGTFPGFRNAWLDMFRHVVQGKLYIPTREQVVSNIRVAILNTNTTGNDESKYATWGDLYTGLYLQQDPMNIGTGQWMSNLWYLKRTGRYGTIPLTPLLHDSIARAIPVQVRKSAAATRWPDTETKVAEFDRLYPAISSGDLYVSRLQNQLITYTPYSYVNSRTTATGRVPLLYNTCDSLILTLGKLSSGAVREYPDHIDLYLNNYRADTTDMQLDQIVVRGATAQPSHTLTRTSEATARASETYDPASGDYTLQVRHNGPVDVTIQCAGTATGRHTDLLPDTPLTADLPRQPKPFRGEVVIEAEDMDFRDLPSLSWDGLQGCMTSPYDNAPDVRGHSGNGFVNFGTATAASLRHQYRAPEAGPYVISVRYTSPSRAAVISAKVGAKTVRLTCPKTATNQWRHATFDADLVAGTNTLVLTNTGGASPYIDNISYRPADIPAERYAVTIRPADHGTVIASADSACEGESVTLNIVPDEGYAFAAWEVLRGGVTVSDDGTFTMPDEAVALQPRFVDTTVAAQLDFTSVLGGAMPEGWVAVQENNETHSWPNTYSSGARTMTGFSGYQGKALYWRNGTASLGTLAASPLTLEPGHYRLTFAMAAWKGMPRYDVQILGPDGAALASSATYAAQPNANGNSSADVASARHRELEFDVTTAGRHTIRFTDRSNATSGYTEFLLLECRVNRVPEADAIAAPDAAPATAPRPSAIYNAAGQRRARLARGLNLVQMSDGTTRKVLVK